MLDGLSVVCSRETAVTRAEAEAEKSEGKPMNQIQRMENAEVRRLEL